MSRRMVAPGVWEPEGPRVAVRTDPRIAGCAIETRGTQHKAQPTTPSRTAEYQREYRERKRAYNAARYQRSKAT